MNALNFFLTISSKTEEKTHIFEKNLLKRYSKTVAAKFQNQGDLCNKNSCLLQKYSKNVVYSKIEVLLYVY